MLRSFRDVEAITDHIVWESRPTGVVTEARSCTNVDASARTYTVAPKDTLFSIARRHNVSVSDLLAANRSQLPSASTPLRVGMTLRIP